MQPQYIRGQCPLPEEVNVVLEEVPPEPIEQTLSCGLAGGPVRLKHRDDGAVHCIRLGDHIVQQQPRKTDESLPRHGMRSQLTNGTVI